MCPCGRSGHFHVCLLNTTLEPDLCQTCGGFGRYIAQPDLPVWHPDYYADCSCPLTKRLDGQEQQRRRLAALDRISETARHDMTFENFDTAWTKDKAKQAELNQALGLAQSFAQDPSAFAWSITLRGPFGCGKTHLGRAIQAHRQGNGSGAVFAVVPDLLDHIRSTYNHNAGETYGQRFNQVRDAPFLILDDLGAEKSTDWVDEKLFQVLNHRYNNLLPTVVLTNVSLDQLEQRIASRLHEGIIHTITAGDYRRRGETDV